MHHCSYISLLNLQHILFFWTTVFLLELLICIEIKLFAFSEVSTYFRSALYMAVMEGRFTLLCKNGGIWKAVYHWQCIWLTFFQQVAEECDKSDKTGLLSGIPITLKDHYNIKVRSLQYCKTPYFRRSELLRFFLISPHTILHRISLKVAATFFKFWKSDHF